MLQLDERAVHRLLTMDTAIAAMQDLLDRTRRGDIDVIFRRRLEADAMYLATMSAVDRGHHLFAAKLYTTGSHRGSFMLLLWGSRTGQLLAMLEANRLGQLRTGAVSAIATDRLALPQADTLLVIGTGFQAETQVLAISRVRPIQTVFIHSRHPRHRQDFVERLRPQLDAQTRLVPIETVPTYAAQAQIIVTATTAHDPVIRGEWIQPGTHINAIGSNHPQDREVDAETLRRAAVIVTDHIAGARIESGDLLLGLPETEWHRVISLEHAPARVDAQAISLFVSQGIASEDLVLAEYAVNRWMHTRGGSNP